MTNIPEDVMQAAREALALFVTSSKQDGALFCNIIARAIAADRKRRVKVKPLEWDGSKAESCFGRYEFSVYPAGRWVVWLADEPIREGQASSEEAALAEAKAFAQAHRERYALDEVEFTDRVESFQSRVAPWMDQCFGPEISADRLERGDRFLEEALELLQSGGYQAERVAQLASYVYSRPAGEPAQEVGGVMVTLAAYCLAHDLDMHAAGETELARVWTKIDTIREKQAAKPRGSALPIPLSDDDLADLTAVYLAGAHDENRRLLEMHEMGRRMDKARIVALEAELASVLDGTAHEADLVNMEALRAEMRERATLAGGRINALEARLVDAEADAMRLAEVIRHLSTISDDILVSGVCNADAAMLREAWAHIDAALATHEVRKG